MALLASFPARRISALCDYEYLLNQLIEAPFTIRLTPRWFKHLARAWNRPCAIAGAACTAV